MASEESHTALAELVRLYQVEPGYRDSTGQYRAARPEALLAVLRQLGAPLGTPEEAPAALAAVRRARQAEILPPVWVVWGNDPVSLPVTLPAAWVGPVHRGCVELEDGRVRLFNWDSAAARGGPPQDGYMPLLLNLAGRLPYGYHRLMLEMPGQSVTTLLIAAPRRACTLPRAEARQWGLFLPLYALHTMRSWGGGNFNDLSELMAWTGERGGRLVGTLPLLASFPDRPEGYSPYTPVSRLAWNEYYLDIPALPEFARSAAARDLYQSALFQRELVKLQGSPLVDHENGGRLRRRLLTRLADFMEQDEPGRGEMAAFAAAQPRIADYAAFRAVMEAQRRDWPDWPAPLRAGRLNASDYEAAAYHYHLYVQMRARQQLAQAAARGREKHVRLYLDLPLGVHAAGYDAWRWQELFMSGLAVGAPPDAIFSGGQNWNFPPLHPERSRHAHYQYFRACLRHHMEHAGILRLDHVMGLHRLFCIPAGMAARDGVYVRYPAAEIYAIVCIESRRAGCLVLGEDLGTVPPEVRPALAEHGIYRTYVLQYELTDRGKRPCSPVPERAVASLNTHDMPPWAAFWAGRDLDTRRRLGLLTASEAAAARRRRHAIKQSLALYLERRGLLQGSRGVRSLLGGALALLGRSRARLVLVNLEDLWAEMGYQNVPGTGRDFDNWRRRARYSLESFTGRPGVRARLKILDQCRRKGNSP